MAYGPTDAGKELLARDFGPGDVSKPGSVAVGLYNENTDGVLDTEYDPGTAITTEPSGASYARLSYTFNTTDMDAIAESTGWAIDFVDKDFDVTDSTQTVDGYFVVASFTSEVAGSAGTWLVFRGALGETVNLSNVPGTYPFVDGGMIFP